LTARPRAGILPWLALVTVWFVWGSTFLGIRVAVQSIPPFLMAGVRYAIAGGLLYLLVRCTSRGPARPISREQWKRLAISGVLLIVLGNGLLSFAEVRMASGPAALIVATVPVWMIVIDAIYSRRRMSKWSIAGLLFGTLGVAALVGIPSGEIPLSAAGIVLVSSFSWAVGSVYTRHSAEDDLNALFPALEMFIGGVGLLIVAACTGEFAAFRPTGVTHAAIAGFLWLVFAGAMLGYSAYALAVRALPARITATYAYVNPIVAVALGSLVLGEPVTPNILAGGSVIVLSVGAIMMARSH
jgi:drug/metabolite transporter (DMT)-like permease